MTMNEVENDETQHPNNHIHIATDDDTSKFPTTTTTTASSSSVYLQVKYKKVDGRLTLTAQALSFWPGSNNITTGTTSNASPLFSVEWQNVLKHQVSPANYPKPLLKVLLGGGASGGTAATFQMAHRPDLERIRKEITLRLQQQQQQQQQSGGGASDSAMNTSNKRPRDQLTLTVPITTTTSSKSSSFGEMDPTALAVTRSSLLAANPVLRQQHAYLVEESQTLSEHDFWETHHHLVEEEYARLAGLARAGTSSLLQSHLPSSGRVTLGVEEMRQIFILYPAVHKAYEEKVPLELSDEQFWRKYLESEYFHRDRGRMGTAARNHAPGANAAAMNEPKTKKGKQQQQQQQQPAAGGGLSVEEQDARAAAVRTDDLFSRYDQKLKERGLIGAGGDPTDQSSSTNKAWGRKLAVGQFDLASTYETERGNLLEGPKDNYPPNQLDDGKGSRVIQKYNRHWAMVLHPDEAIAGSNLMDVARRSVEDVLPDDTDAVAGGGEDEEMYRLVQYASAAEEEADHALGVGSHEEYERLTLRNIEAYYAGQLKREAVPEESKEEAQKRHSIFAKAMAGKMRSLTQSFDRGELPLTCFPPAGLGRELLSALTKKMAQDSRTEAASLEAVNKLPEDFRKKLQTYFRRSSELLRHFFALRKLDAQGPTGGHAPKLARIVKGMESFYREMEVMRKGLPQNESGEMMRKMCLPIMDQLDWAFKLQREGGGGGGGFVAVDEG